MFFQCFCEDEDVIHVYCHSPFFYKLPKQFIHHCLEGGWAVTKAEEHDQWFEKSSIGSKSCLPFISFPYTDIVVAPSYIKFCEIFGTHDTTHNVRNKRKWVAISYCHGV